MSHQMEVVVACVLLAWCSTVVYGMMPMPEAIGKYIYINYSCNIINVLTLFLTYNFSTKLKLFA